MEYDPLEETLVTVGGSEGIDLALRAMLDPGDEVLIPQPSYVSYLPCTVLADGVPVILELKEENQFRLTREELLEKITDRTKVLVLPFPNNPTGAVMRREDLEAVAEVVREKDLYVISDEIYSETDVWRASYLHGVSSWDEREDADHQRIFQILCHDRMETWLYLRPERDHPADDQDPSVRHHVRADQQPVRGGGKP